MGVSSVSSIFLTTSGPQVNLVSPATAIQNIKNTAAQLDVTGGVSLQTEGTLEQQLVKEISAANPSANQGTIAVVADDLDGASSSTQITNDLNALIRMVQPTVGATNLTNTIDSIANLLRVQASSTSTTVATPPPPVSGQIAATALTGATSLTLTSTSGMTAGDSFQVTLDTGETFYTSIASIANNVVTLSSALPSQASNGNMVSDLAGITTYQTMLQNAANAGDSTVTLMSAGGISTGDSIQLELDTGVLFTTQVTGVNGNVVSLAEDVPGTASAGNNVADETNPYQTINQNTNLGSTSNTVTYYATITSPANAGTSVITLNTVGGMSVGDTLQIQLDNGSTFTTQINNINTAALQVTLAQPLPSAANLDVGGDQQVADTVQLFPTATTYTPSEQMANIFNLQINDLITAANDTVSLSQLTEDIAALSAKSLTNTQFQQALTTLNNLWSTTLPNGATISVLA